MLRSLRNSAGVKPKWWSVILVDECSVAQGAVYKQRFEAFWRDAIVLGNARRAITEPVLRQGWSGGAWESGEIGA